MADITAEPMSWLALEARKWLMFWNQNESRTNASLDFVSRFSPVVAFDFLGFGVLAIAGVYGLLLVLGRADAIAAALLSVAVFAPLVVCLLFFVSGEYRHPAAPALAILAGLSFAHLLDENAKRARRSIAIWPRRIAIRN